MFDNIPFKLENIKKIDKGLTNDNYLVQIKDSNYILRHPKDDTMHLFDRNAESIIVNKLKGKDYILNPFYYKDGIQIVEYKDNLISFDNYSKPNKIKKVATLMKQLHSEKIHVDHSFDPIKQIYKYHQHTSNIKIDLNDYTELFDQVKHHTFTPVLCHNDWVEGNICFINDDIYLIDFEYAGMNDRYFDIMSFFTENDLTLDQKKEFIDEMFNSNLDDKTLSILEMYRDVNNILWYLWAEMMYKFRGQSIYKDISDIKYNQLMNEYRKPLF